MIQAVDISLDDTPGEQCTTTPEVAARSSKIPVECHDVVKRRRNVG